MVKKLSYKGHRSKIIFNTHQKSQNETSQTAKNIRSKGSLRK